MHKSKTCCAATLLASLLIAPAASAMPSGAYPGQIESAGYYVPAVTTFKTDDQGRIGGSYEYRQNRHRYPGVLSDCEYNGDLSLRCLWRDEAGDGVVTFAFDIGFGRFVGLWKDGEGNEVYGWAGEKPLKKRGGK